MGIDISSKFLELHVIPQNQAASLPDDPEGISENGCSWPRTSMSPSSSWRPPAASS